MILSFRLQLIQQTLREHTLAISASGVIRNKANSHHQGAPSVAMETTTQTSTHSETLPAPWQQEACNISLFFIFQSTN